MTPLNAVDSSAWLEYFADTKRAKLFAAAIEDTEHLIVVALNAGVHAAGESAQVLHVLDRDELDPIAIAHDAELFSGRELQRLANRLRDDDLELG